MKKILKLERDLDPSDDLSLANLGRDLKLMDSKYKMLLQSEIEDVQKRAKSAAECARMLHVSYSTYRKYAKMYGIFEVVKNPSGIGISKGWTENVDKYDLNDVLAGKHPKYAIKYLKPRLIEEGVFDEKCSACGFEEKRITDNKVPLLLNHIDEDRTNHKLENLELLCYNCKFLLVGNLTGRKNTHNTIPTLINGFDRSILDTDDVQFDESLLESEDFEVF